MNNYIAQRYGSIKSGGSGTKVGQPINIVAANNQIAPAVAERVFAQKGISLKDLNVGIKLVK
jgi:hypothetical protein